MMPMMNSPIYIYAKTSIDSGKNGKIGSLNVVLLLFILMARGSHI